ncbi:MAG: SusC/RagA family TonB-linked outer membrane protein, partial [Bacteroidota bacterium]|nr:SusC/RagA family TonB-linked outer membrane protein [Bacteroidota bacterium]
MRKFLLFIFLALATTHGFCQGSIISGTVTDQNGNPLVGATIAFPNGGQSTTTNSAGTFSTNVPANTKQIEVSYVGYLKQTVSIGNQRNLSISLSPSDPGLSEVVVVAYGTVKKEALTGSIGTIKATDIAKRPIANITSAIEGAIPGVITSTTSGQPGAGLSIRVRGFGSINASSDPLYVVDGVPYVGNTANINPDDVESITVLKDAASSALYGSRAANGVVIITSKKGRKGRNNISVNIKQGIAQRGLPEYDRLNAHQYYPIMWEAYRNSLVYPATGTGISLDSANRVASGLTSRTSIKGLLAYNPFNVADNTIVGTDGKINPNAKLLYADDLDWTKDLLRNGPRKDYSVNFNGGSDKSDYYLSLGHVDESGYTLKTDYKRYTARLNVNVQPKTWLKTGLNMSGNYSVSNVANDASSTTFVNPFFFSRNIGPIYPVYAHNMTTGEYLIDPVTNQKYWDLGNMNGTLGVPSRPSGGFGGRQALAETSLNDNLFRRSVASARNYVDITFLKDFKFTNNISVDIQNQNSSTYQNTLVGDGAPGGRASKEAFTSTGLTLNQLLNYGKQLSDHRIDVLLGHETFNDYETDQYGFKQGQTSSGNTELNNFTTINAVTSQVDKYHIESYFSRLNYDFKSKYFLSGSIRTDGNSKFAAESRWGTFWSVGGGWRIEKEEFMKKFSGIDFLKLRG